jgi:hypothetical protein
VSPLGVRERPPLRLSYLIESPDGARVRWAIDDPDPRNAPKDVNFGSVMPGGYDRFNCTLERNPRFTYPDTQPLSKLTAMGPGGTTAWQGRLEKSPDTAGFQSQKTPEAVGYQVELEDDATAREIYIDQDQSRWEDMALARKLENTALSMSAPTTIGGSPNAVQTGFNGPWIGAPLSEAWYDAHGIDIGKVYAEWAAFGSAVNPADTKWDWEISLSPNDHGAGTTRSGNLRTTGFPGATTLVAPGPGLNHAILSLLYAEGEKGTDQLYAVLWQHVVVYGRHGLPIYGAGAEGGLLASDIVANAVRRWTGLSFTTGPEGTIQPSTFIIPQLAFTDPTNVAEILRQAARFELQDWAVWDERTFYMNERGTRGRKWRARVGPAQLQQTGKQVSRLWNGVAVAYQDVTGASMMVGPPGFAGGNAETEDPNLLDSDPENPLNKIGDRKWALLKMGTSTLEGAKTVGRKFLEESRGLDSSGQASLVGHVEDEGGTLWPAWMVKGGDSVSFVDAADPSPRRVVSAHYDDNSKTNSLQLDQPPESMQALLERLSVSLVGLGLS